MNNKNFLIYGWRGINQSLALVNQNQLLCLQKYNNLSIFHLDAPFYNLNWNSKNNSSGFDSDQLCLINQPTSPPQDLTVDCIYTATFPFDIFHNLPSNHKFKSKRILNFIVTEFGLSDSDFVSINGNPRNLLRDDDYIISPSHWSKNKIIEYGFQESRVKIVPHGIDPKVYFPPNQETKNQLKTNLGLNKNDFLFVNMSDFDPLKYTDDDLAVHEAKPQLKKPPLYKVVLLNDDFTPMDFVVFVLKDIFRRTHEEAVGIMLEIHNKGEGICGVYTRDVAETKAELAITVARRHEHPLQCRVEKE